MGKERDIANLLETDCCWAEKEGELGIDSFPHGRRLVGKLTWKMEARKEGGLGEFINQQMESFKLLKLQIF
jgi:hypothetical protein